MTETQPALHGSPVPDSLSHSIQASPQCAGFMKRLLPLLLLLSVLLTGCARNYVITMSNGSRVTTKGKPKLQDGIYVFKDFRGQPGQVPAGRVREIAPASMAKEEGSQFFK